LPTRGTLWTWTSQEFEPASPPYKVASEKPFESFAVGYVEFAGYLRVEGLLTDSNSENLRIGMEMDLTTFSRGTDLAYGFTPVMEETEG